MANQSVKNGDSVIQCNDNIQPGDSITEEKSFPVSGKVLRSRLNRKNITDSYVIKVSDNNVCKRVEENIEIGQRRHRGRGPNKARDATAPSKPGAPFILYCKDERPNVTKELKICPEGPAMIKELAQRWERLDEKVKEVYKKRSAAERVKYNQAMLEYKPSQEFLRKKAESDLKRKNHRLQTQSEQPRKRGRGEGAAFMLYCNEERPKVLKEVQNCSESNVSKVLAQRWDGLDEKVRATFKERAKKECKNEYNKVMEGAQYNQEFCRNNS